MPSNAKPHSSPRRAFASDERGVQEVIGFILIFGLLSAILVLSMAAFNVAQVAARSRVVELRATSAAARVAGIVVQSAVLAEQQGSGNLAVSYQVDLPDQLEGYDYKVYLQQAASRTKADAVLAANSPTLTSASAAFTAADVGRTVTGTALRSGSMILSVQSATKATLSVGALSSGSAQSVTISGPDQVVVAVPTLNIVVAEPVFSAGQSTAIKICASTTNLGGTARVVYDDPTKASYAALSPSPFLGACPPAGVTRALFIEAA